MRVLSLPAGGGNGGGGRYTGGLWQLNVWDLMRPLFPTLWTTNYTPTESDHTSPEISLQKDTANWVARELVLVERLIKNMFMFTHTHILPLATHTHTHIHTYLPLANIATHTK